ncbi:MAG TPA: hypothetical protein VHS57_05935 [Acidimicrobiales bacterium]|nr:hypothetical protein [Acidimicrobiales bacterium]
MYEGPSAPSLTITTSSIHSRAPRSSSEVVEDHDHSAQSAPGHHLALEPWFSDQSQSLIRLGHLIVGRLNHGAGRPEL